MPDYVLKIQAAPAVRTITLKVPVVIPANNLDFSSAQNSQYLALLFGGIPSLGTASPFVPSLDFSNPKNSDYLALILGGNSTAAPPPPPVGVLGSGVNLGMQHVAGTKPLTLADFATLSAYGVDHVRIPLTPSIVFADNLYTTFNESVIERVDNIIDMATQYGMICILDNHPKVVTTDYVNVIHHINEYWTAIAGRYKHYPLNVYYEVLNEPGNDPGGIPPVFPNGGGTWQAFHQQAINTIRSVDPTPGRWIMVDAQYGGYISGFDGNVRPFSDQHIIYSAHVYNPIGFTHQGVPFDDTLKHFHDIAYPTNPAVIDAFYAQYAPTAKTPARTVVYDAAQLLLEIRTLFYQAWGQKYNVPIHIGEFGIWQGVTDEGSRLRWMTDVIAACRTLNIPYTMFAYQSNFPLDSQVLSLINQ